MYIYTYIYVMYIMNLCTYIMLDIYTYILRHVNVVRRNILSTLFREKETGCRKRVEFIRVIFKDWEQ